MTASEHEEHCRHVSLRAVLQLWMDRHGLHLTRRKRRPVCRQGRDTDIHSFVASLADCYDLGCVDWDYREELRRLYAANAQLFDLTEVLTGLQFLLQAVIEGVLLEDRRVFLEQQHQEGIVCGVWQIFDEELSPRNKLLLAYKS